MKAHQTVDYHIKAAWHAISRMYNAQAVKHEMTASIGYVLLNIDVEKGTSATKIAPLLGLETRSLTRMLKTMEEDKMIYREADLNDKRGVKIKLTEEGKRKREVARKTVIAFNKMIQENISSAKLEVFFEVIEEINKLVENKKSYQEIEV
ncbi:MarR family transcriptional regulator [Rhodocytophaga aerolata]|uniref:MarR family transcriptional regulator n=1 Tax=Rhodocytophaga aerolata TaxID=455078 RepID=A0ABT8R4C1_9BACT|nr:MarR family transcriptional regulator [Rhodocytophaga aerolata]MDO1446244.1 MarR family transcriptional regulator [Rhodocytophaga aerolata]